MTYIENVFACIAAPLLVAGLCAGKKHAHLFIFVLAGMLSCLLSAYVNTFFAALLDASALGATAEIAPVVEEVMKLMPLLFYLLVFEPEGDRIRSAILATAAGFATFENVCYLLENGAEDLGFLLIRGFGTGAMHVMCGVIVGYGMVYVWPRGALRAAGSCALLGTAVVFHGVCNLMAAYGGRAQYVAYALPLLLLAAGYAARRLYAGRAKIE